MFISTPVHVLQKKNKRFLKHISLICNILLNPNKNKKNPPIILFSIQLISSLSHLCCGTIKFAHLVSANYATVSEKLRNIFNCYDPNLNVTRVETKKKKINVLFYDDRNLSFIFYFMRRHTGKNYFTMYPNT